MRARCLERARGMIQSRGPTPRQRFMARIVLESLESFERDRCVDLFRRDDGTFGFESFRRDPEAQGWYSVGGFSDEIFPSREAAVAAARRRVSWFEEPGTAER